MDNTKERPIVLTVQEVNAVLACDKTQHRFFFDFAIMQDHNCPFGEAGDRLWVQELHARTENEVLFTAPHYFADGSLTLDLRHDAGLLTNHTADDMPRWASRLLLEITDIRMERLNDISEADAIAEGIKPIHSNPADRVGPNHFTKSNGWYHCSRPTAAEVFTEMYGVSDDFDKYGENPWVWVIEFKVIKED